MWSWYKDTRENHKGDFFELLPRHLTKMNDFKKVCINKNIFEKLIGEDGSPFGKLNENNNKTNKAIGGKKAAPKKKPTTKKPVKKVEPKKKSATKKPVKKVAPKKKPVKK